MKNYLLIILCSFLLTACNNEQTFIGDTPDEAVEALEIDFVTDMQGIQFIDVNTEQKISIFEAATANISEREYYVAFVKKKGKKGIIKEAIGVGNTAIKSSANAAESIIGAKFVNMTNDSSTPQFINALYTFTLPDSKISLWVEILE